mmetsp:Transcript_4527/g.14395  ORF Transcript_4527/g.14395 Transcript_4527/m.14395 type:complete len:238 (-) Transcript_4527:49-762(-)
MAVVYRLIRSSSSRRICREAESQSRVRVVADPKSQSLQTPRASTRTFSSLRSRCATGGLCACRWATPLHTCKKLSSVSGNGSGGGNAPEASGMQCLMSVPCEQYSRRSRCSWPRTPARCVEASMPTMFGCRGSDSIRSRSALASSADSASCASIRLTAKSSPVSACRAMCTYAKPPSASATSFMRTGYPRKGTSSDRAVAERSAPAPSSASCRASASLDSAIFLASSARARPLSSME